MIYVRTDDMKRDYSCWGWLIVDLWSRVQLTLGRHDPAISMLSPLTQQHLQAASFDLRHRSLDLHWMLGRCLRCLESRLQHGCCAYEPPELKLQSYPSGQTWRHNKLSLSQSPVLQL